MKRTINYTFKKRHVLYAVIVSLALYCIYATIPFGAHVFNPDAVSPAAGGRYSYDVPLDPESPWPRFRVNSLQNGRSPVMPAVNPSLRPWAFRTGKGIFSSPVIDGSGTVYIGSADHHFYSIKKDGSLNWKIRTGEIIDSSALLDDRGRVFVGSGDGHVYALERNTGKVLWKSMAHSVQEVEKQFNVKTYNVNWFEGNIGMLKDGTIIAPNDNYLVYQLDRETGGRKTQHVVNEMVWSLPAVNTRTGRIFFGSQFMALKNVFCYNSVTGEREWASGGLGSNAASPLLTSRAENGAVILGGYDGYVRAYSQERGKQLWKRGLRDHIYSSPAQLSDGTIIQPSTDGTVYALDPRTGDVRWAFDTLEPIRSSPAVDGKDSIYVGTGEGRLYCINPDGTLRWSYLCIDEDRNDLNSSPGLGKEGVYIAGENGGVFFIPYDYPLTPAGTADPRCDRGPGEKLPSDGAFLVYTERFGGLPVGAPGTIDANQPLAFTLFVRKGGDTLKTAIDRESLEVKVSGDAKFGVDVSANRQFLIVTPRETWTGAAGGPITITLKGAYVSGMRRVGLKFFGGSRSGEFEKRFEFTVPARGTTVHPYRVPVNDGDPSTVFEFSRLAAPNPTMLPSWNQIGFDSLHYLAGAIEGKGNTMLLWVIGGKSENGATVVNPALEARYPLTLSYDGGLATLYNYDGFKINFIGSWDMPFGRYRLATKVNPLTGAVLRSPALCAIALGDEIEFYGRFLKLMGMTEFDTGHMAVFGGLNMALYGRGYATRPVGVGNVAFSADGTKARAEITGGSLRAGRHVYSLVLVERGTGRALPLYYTKNTGVTTAKDGTVTSVFVTYDKGQVSGSVKAYLMVDTYPAARGLVTVR